jgi:hypothetical protein
MGAFMKAEREKENEELEDAENERDGLQENTSTFSRSGGGVACCSS